MTAEEGNKYYYVNLSAKKKTLQTNMSFLFIWTSLDNPKGEHTLRNEHDPQRES